jgi:hypothetical protein
MNNTSTDNFERIAEDTMEVLVAVIGALGSDDEHERQATKLIEHRSQRRGDYPPRSSA